MKKPVKYIIILLITILPIGLITGWGIILYNFDLFGKPQKDILSVNCDPEGRRQAIIYDFGGNAVTIPLIAVSIVPGCSGDTEDEDHIVVFSADHRRGNVETEWISSDTLKLKYSENLKPINMIDRVNFNNSSHDIIVLFEKF